MTLSDWFIKGWDAAAMERPTLPAFDGTTPAQDIGMARAAWIDGFLERKMLEETNVSFRTEE